VRYRVAVTVRGGGKHDLDRVCTAVLDALQAGGGVRKNDCLVDALRAARLPLPRGARPATEAALAAPPTAPPTGPAAVAGRVPHTGRGGHGRQPP
jgi:hypothetical protein